MDDEDSYYIGFLVRKIDPDTSASFHLKDSSYNPMQRIGQYNIITCAHAPDGEEDRWKCNSRK